MFIPNRGMPTKQSLGFFDQVSSQSKDHLEALKNEVLKVQNVVQSANAPYQGSPPVPQQ